MQSWQSIIFQLTSYLLCISVAFFLRLYLFTALNSLHFQIRISLSLCVTKAAELLHFVTLQMFSSHQSISKIFLFETSMNSVKNSIYPSTIQYVYYEQVCNRPTWFGSFWPADWWDAENAGIADIRNSAGTLSNSTTWIGTDKAGFVSYPLANKLVIVASSILFESPPRLATHSQNCCVTFFMCSSSYCKTKRRSQSQDWDKNAILKMTYILFITWWTFVHKHSIFSEKKSYASIQTNSTEQRARRSLSGICQ